MRDAYTFMTINLIVSRVLTQYECRDVFHGGTAVKTETTVTSTHYVRIKSYKLRIRLSF